MMFPLSLQRFLLVWMVMAAAMTTNGIAREALLKRVVSVQLAGIISAAIGIVLIGLITRVGFAPLATLRDLARGIVADRVGVVGGDAECVGPVGRVVSPPT